MIIAISCSTTCSYHITLNPYTQLFRAMRTLSLHLNYRYSMNIHLCKQVWFGVRK